MTRDDILQSVCDIIDESKDDVKIKDKLYRFINLGYRSLLRREGKKVEDIPKSGDINTYPENYMYIVFYAAWQYDLVEDEVFAGVYKDEVKGFTIYAPQEFKDIEDVYNIGNIDMGDVIQ